MKKFLLTILILLSVFTPTLVVAAGPDFHIESNIEIKYERKNDFATVRIEYIRQVINGQYYFPADSSKTFPIGDLSFKTEGQIAGEREFKKESINVTDLNGNKLKFSIEESEEGINVVVPNYKQTTKASPYKIYLTYKTHDYVQVVNQNIVIQAPSLPEDTQFEIVDEKSNTATEIEYNLSVLVGKDVAPLAKIWPTTYSKEEEDDFDRYIFPAESRIKQNPYLEFGTSLIYRFEIEYITPKTDSFLPEKYSSLLGNLSKNIFELSLPRHFDENKQRVKIENISPTPTKISRDNEGNIIATFEVDANKEDKISVVGYVWVEQESYNESKGIPDLTLTEYASLISKDSTVKQYLGETKFWQVHDSYIQEEAKKILKGQDNIMELIKADYRYINEKLEYDQSKAESANDRIGAKQALQGEGAVCMEYADAMITILRAQGVASRASIGYANLKDASNTADSQVRHQWVQVWVPNYGWLSIDPTWESENMDIGTNIHRILWETFNGDDLSNTKIYSADSLDKIDDIKFNISVFAVEEKDIEDMEKLKNYDEILPIKDKGQSENVGDWFNKFVKASTIGRSVAIITPILLIVLLLIIVISIVRVAIRQLKKKEKNKNL